MSYQKETGLALGSLQCEGQEYQCHADPGTDAEIGRQPQGIVFSPVPAMTHFPAVPCVFGAMGDTQVVLSPGPSAVKTTKVERDVDGNCVSHKSD